MWRAMKFIVHGSFLLAFSIFNACSFADSESRVQVAFGTPLKMGATELHFISIDVALLILEHPMTTEGIKIAKVGQKLDDTLKMTGFGADENDLVNGQPRTAISKKDWKAAPVENGYGIIGFLKGDGVGCKGDSGAPVVSAGYLVGISSIVNQPRSKKCRDVEDSILADMRLMRGWLKCASTQLGYPLPQVADAQDDEWCGKNEIVNYPQ